MRKSLDNNRGFGTIITITVLAVVVVSGIVGWTVYSHNKTNAHASSSNSKSTTPKPNPYSGWKSATSSRAGFTIKYPTNWKFVSAIGNNDNVEHITISSSQFQISINSFNGKDAANGGQPATTCSDCIETLSSSTFDAPSLGKVNLNNISYKLDSGKGYALILQLPDSTYYVPSPTNQTVTSSFRGISVLDSLQAYQAETYNEFTSNPDYPTAKLILESLSY